MKGIFGIVIIAFAVLAFTEGGCLRGAKSSSKSAPPETEPIEEIAQSLENDAIVAEATVQLPPAQIPIHRTLQRSGRSVEYTFSLELPNDAANIQSSGLDSFVAVMPINEVSEINEKPMEDAIANETPIALIEPLDSVIESPAVPIPNDEALQRRKRSVKDASEDIIESLSWENNAIAAEAAVQKTEMSSSKLELPPALIPIRRTLLRNGRSVEYIELPNDAIKTQSSRLDSRVAVMPINEVSQIIEEPVEDAIANETPIALIEPLDSVVDSPAVPISNNEALLRRERSMKDASEDIIESRSFENDAIAAAAATVQKTEMSSSKFELPPALIPIHRTLQRSGRSVEYTFSLELPNDVANIQSSGLDPRPSVVPINKVSQISEKAVGDSIASETPITLTEPLDSVFESPAVPIPNNEALQRRERSVKDASEDIIESRSWENDAIAAETAVQKTEMSSSKLELPPSQIPIRRSLLRNRRSVEYIELPNDAIKTQSSGLDSRVAVMPINEVSQISEEPVEDAITNEAPIALIEPLHSVVDSPAVPISNNEALQRRERSMKDASEDIIKSRSWENDAIAAAAATVQKTEMSSSKSELPSALIPIHRTLQRNGRSVEYSLSLELPNDAIKTQSSGLDSRVALMPINEVSEISERSVEDSIANEAPIALTEPLDSVFESPPVPNKEALLRREISV